jgi:hypothetical protein
MLRKRLRRNDAHARFSPRNRSAYGQVARLHGDAKLPSRGVAATIEYVAIS